MNNDKNDDSNDDIIEIEINPRQIRVIGDNVYYYDEKEDKYYELMF